MSLVTLPDTGRCKCHNAVGMDYWISYVIMSAAVWSSCLQLVCHYHDRSTLWFIVWREKRQYGPPREPSKTKRNGFKLDIQMKFWQFNFISVMNLNFMSDPHSSSNHHYGLTEISLNHIIWWTLPHYLCLVYNTGVMSCRLQWQLLKCYWSSDITIDFFTQLRRTMTILRAPLW